MKKINVVFASNAETIDYCVVSMLSVLKNKSRNDYICFYYLADEYIKFYHKQKFSCLNTKESVIKFLSIRSSDYDSMRNSTLRKDLPNNAYYRLSIADKLCDEEKALYIDYDTYTCTSLSSLYDTDISTCYLAAVLDIWDFQRRTELNEVGIFTRTHYNSGVMLLNLKKWRNDNVFHKLKKFAKEHPQKFLLADQFLINSVIQDVKIIDYKYNLQVQQHFEPIQYTDLNRYNNDIKNPVIIHYVFGKPWEFSKCQHPVRYKWWEIAHAYPYYEELLKLCLKASLGHEIKNAIMDLINYKKNRIQYIRYKILSSLTFGEIRLHYQKKEIEYLKRLKRVHSFFT